MQEFIESLPLTQLETIALALVYAGVAYLVIRFLLRYLKRVPTIYKHRRIAQSANILFTLYILIWGLGIRDNIAQDVILTIVLLLAGYLTVVTIEYSFFEMFLHRDRRIVTPGLPRDVLRMAILLIVVYAVLLSVFNLDLSTVLVSSAVLTAIIGLALQDLLSNVLAGVALHIEKPFKVGDWVQVAGQQGEVAGISWRATRIKTLENNFVIIPNNSISQAEIINYTEPEPVQGRFLNIGASYNDPPNKVKKAIEEVAAQVPGILKNPPPSTRAIEYSDFSINYECKYFIDDYSMREDIGEEFVSRLWYKFKREGIEIPFPIRTLRPMAWAERMKESDEKANKQKVRGYLRSHELFADLTDEEIEKLTEDSAFHLFGVDEDIITQSDEGNSMFVIISGEAQILVSQNGREVEMARLGPGESIGEMSLFTGEKRTATVRCAEDSELVEITKENFKGILMKNPALVERLSEKISIRSKEIKDTLQATSALQLEDDNSETEKESFVRIIKNFFEL